MASIIILKIFLWLTCYGNTFTTSQECNVSGECSSNYICSQSELENGICTCRHGFINYEADCRSIIGQDCSEHSQHCQAAYTRAECIEDACDCGTESYLNPLLNVCVDKPSRIYDPCATSDNCDEIANTVCSNNLCICNPETHLVNLETETCDPLPNQVGDPCNFNRDCLKFNFSTCQQTQSSSTFGSCGCIPNYIANNGMCKSLCVNGECSDDQYCVGNSYCDPKKYVGEACSQSSECLDPNSICSGYCICTDNYKLNPANNRTCILQTCPTELNCSNREYCNDGVCFPKSYLGETCTDSEKCLGSHSICDGVCLCHENYKNNTDTTNNEICILKTCPGDLSCSSGQFCNIDGVCQPKKSLGSFCNETSECAGNLVVCGGQQSNGIRTCHCPNNLIPDRPVDDPNFTCIEIIATNLNCSARDGYGNEWSAVPNEVKAQNCPRGLSGTATWRCLPSGKFQDSQPNYTNCTTQWVGDLGNQLEQLLGTDNKTIVAENATVFIDSMKDHLQKALVGDNDQSPGQNTENQFFGHEIQSMIDMMNTVVSKVDVPDREANATISAYENVTAEVYSATNLLLRFVKPWEQLPQSNRTKSFVNVLSLINEGGFQLSTKVRNFSVEENDKYSISRNQKAFLVESGFSKPEDTRNFPANGRRKKGKDSFIGLPRNWGGGQEILSDLFESGQHLYVGVDVGVQYARNNIPGQIINIKDQRVDATKSINGDLLGFNVQNEKQKAMFEGGERIFATFKHDSDSWGDQPKKIPRKLHEGEQPKAAAGSTECVYFDEEHNMWSSEGSKLEETSTFSTTCSYSRSGYFAVATKFHEYVGKSTGMQAVTIFFPAAASLFEVVSALRSSKSTTRAIRSTNDEIAQHMKLITTSILAVTNLLIAAFVDRNFFNLSDGWCYFVGLLSHFLTLVTFTFFVNMCINIYFTIYKIEVKMPSQNVIVNSVMTNERFMYCVATFGISAFIVFVTTMVGVGAGSHTQVYGGDFCWLDGSYIWALFAPGIMAIVIISLVFYSFNKQINEELRTLQTNSSQTGADTDRKSTLRRAKKEICHHLIFSIIVGLTWLVGYYQLGPHYVDSPFLQYLFPVMFAIQGGFLYWFDNDIKSIRDLIPCLKKKKEAKDGVSNCAETRKETKVSSEDDQEDLDNFDENGTPVKRIHFIHQRRSQRRRNSDVSMA